MSQRATALYFAGACRSARTQGPPAMEGRQKEQEAPVSRGVAGQLSNPAVRQGAATRAHRSLAQGTPFRPQRKEQGGVLA